MPRMKIANGTWILVGDGRRAMVLRNDGLAEAPNLHCIASRETANPPTPRAGAATRPAAPFASVGAMRSSVGGDRLARAGRASFRRQPGRRSQRRRSRRPLRPPDRGGAAAHPRRAAPRPLRRGQGASACRNRQGPDAPHHRRHRDHPAGRRLTPRSRTRPSPWRVRGGDRKMIPLERPRRFARTGAAFDISRPCFAPLEGRRRGSSARETACRNAARRYTRAPCSRASTPSPTPPSAPPASPACAPRWRASASMVSSCRAPTNSRANTCPPRPSGCIG